VTNDADTLATAGDVLAIVPGPHGHDEYVLTGKGLDLWPVIRSLLAWGDDYYSAKGPRRVFRHASDNGEVAQPRQARPSLAALAEPRRLLTSIRS